MTPSGAARYRSASYEETVSRLASNVRRLREARGWTQEELATRAGGMAPRLCRQIEGGATNPTAATLTRLADALGVDVVELLSKAAVLPPRRRGRPRKIVPSATEAGRGASASTPGDPLGADPFATPPAVAAGQVEAVRGPSEPGVHGNALELTEVERRAIAALRAGGVTTIAALHTAPRVEPTTVTVPAFTGTVRDFLLALLAANPRGLLTVEMAEAARATRLRPRRNEVHNLIRTLFEGGHVVREGRRGAYLYRLTEAPEGDPGDDRG